jgi:hypothetical protein
VVILGVSGSQKGNALDNLLSFANRVPEKQYLPAGLRELLAFAKKTGDRYPTGLRVSQMGSIIDGCEATYLTNPPRLNSRRPSLNTINYKKKKADSLLLVRVVNNPFASVGL